MAGSLDDDIELLNNTQVNENPESDTEGLDHLDSGVNPLAFLSRGCSVDESIHQGSIHALKTAFVALQKKNDVQSKKCANLLQRNKALERLITAKPQVIERLHGDIHNMDEPSEVHAAGGTSEDETALAVSRANQGYVQHLEREVMIANNKQKKMIEEIDILRSRLIETERQLVNYTNKEKEELLGNFDVKKNAEVQMLNDKLQAEKTTNEHLKLEFENLRQKLENSDRSNNNRDAEISTYQANLVTTKSELMKTTMQYRELQKQVENLDKENSALKATCKQYEIEVEISRKQRRDQMDDIDDVDGDVAILNKALMLLSSQREEVCRLKAQIAQQNKILNLRSKLMSSLHSSSVRQEPPGAISPPRCEETYYRLQGQVNPVPKNRLTNISRSESARSDFSAGRRVTDSIQPTGNRNIKPMFAMESSSQSKRNEHHFQGNNVIPTLNLRPQNSAIQRTDMTGNHTVIAQPNRRSSNSPRSGNNQSSYSTVTEYSNFSPHANCSSSPGGDSGYSPLNGFTANSASTRTRLPNHGHDYMNMPNDDINVPHMQPNIPLRMTQSEVILRDPTLKGETNNIMSRSVLEPILPLNFEAETNNTSARNHHLLGEIEREETRFSPANATQNNYRNKFQEQSVGPDYENIYVPRPQNDRKCAVEHESNDNAFVVANSSATDRRVSPNRDENNVVSVLNICPSCSREFSRMTQEEFQIHVLNCFDSPDEQPGTLLATGNDDDRTCPMCTAVFPLTIAQDTYEQHVLSHFGDDAGMDRFEMVQ